MEGIESSAHGVTYQLITSDYKMAESIIFEKIFTLIYVVVVMSAMSS